MSHKPLCVMDNPWLEIKRHIVIIRQPCHITKAQKHFFYSLICCAFFCGKITLNDYTTSFCILYFFIARLRGSFPFYFFLVSPARSSLHHHRIKNEKILYTRRKWEFFPTLERGSFRDFSEFSLSNEVSLFVGAAVRFTRQKSVR